MNISEMQTLAWRNSAAELADAVIRIGDLAGILGIDLEEAVQVKMHYNAGRPFLHGGKKY